MDDIAQQLRQFITENFLFGAEAAFADDDSLVGAGIIDSTGVLELIAHLEGEYDIALDDTELVPENLDSISNLVRFIDAKRAAVAVS
ncbi:MAG: acyl carrier protein [Thermoguttaceae bacterium]|jgi:acyl carrier protein|nr:acyl carrier protein [Thermoguttaceae bacterium]